MLRHGETNMKRKMIMNNILIRTILILIIIVLVIIVFDQMTGNKNGIINSISKKNETFSGIQDEDDEQERIILVDGHKAVYLDDENISSGIKAEPLATVSYMPEFSTQARVMDIIPLVTIKADYSNMNAEKNILSDDLNNHSRILKRAEALYETKSLTLRELEKIRAEHAVKYSSLNAMKTRISNFAYEARSKWGGVISDMIFDSDNQTDFDKFASGESSLVIISLLKNQQLDPENQKVYINDISERGTAIKANYIDYATTVENPYHGQGYIYSIDKSGLSAGLKLYAWIEEGSEKINGLFVPERAVIWYANEPWVYIKRKNNLFVRKPLENAVKLPEGWLLKESNQENMPVVTSGGQTLLSEEFKWAIPDEDAD